MRSARELMLAYTATIADPDATAALFTDDGVVELPYLESIGAEIVRRSRMVRSVSGSDRLPPTTTFRCWPEIQPEL